MRFSFTEPDIDHLKLLQAFDEPMAKQVERVRKDLGSAAARRLMFTVSQMLTKLAYAQKGKDTQRLQQWLEIVHHLDQVKRKTA